MRGLYGCTVRPVILNMPCKIWDVMPSRAMAAFATELFASQCEKKLIECADTSPQDATEAALSIVMLFTEGEDSMQMLLQPAARV